MLVQSILSTTTDTDSNCDAVPCSTSESIEEAPNKFMAYLLKLADCCDNELNALLKDHSYAKPWNWRPENAYVKPIKKLFFPKAKTFTSRNKDKQIIDVENVEDDPPLPFNDLDKARNVMDEFQKLANFVRPEDNDDWEEKIQKMFWSSVQTRIFNRTVKILHSERLARLASANNKLEPISRRTSVDIAAKRFHETLASTNWDWKTIQWLHGLLFDHLPQDYLAIYLDILQKLRQRIPDFVEKMISAQPNINSKINSATWETFGPLLKKTWDPMLPAINSNQLKKLPGNPILIVIPNGITDTLSTRQQKWIAQLGSLGTVVTANPVMGISGGRITMIACMEQLVQGVRSKLQETRMEQPGKPIILVGFNSGAALACQIAQIEHVTAVVCLGFPFNTADGKRGSPDDTLVDLRCPVLFVIGQNAMLSKVDDIEDLREKMPVESGLVVVGSADDYLRISTIKKVTEKITQTVVDRCILYEVSDFLGSALVQPHPLPSRATAFNSYNSKSHRFDSRKRKHSTSSSVDSEPPSPGIKKIRSTSPNVNHSSNVGSTNVSASMANLALRTLTTQSSHHTTSHGTQTSAPRRRSRTSNQNNVNPQDHSVSSKIVQQQTPVQNQVHRQNGEKNNGGITLNIGSLASLSPVGPIRFAPSLNTTITKCNKAANTCTNAPRNNQLVNLNSQNIAKIRMIIPQKKSVQKPNSYQNICNNTTDFEKLTHILNSNSSLRITPVNTVSSFKSSIGTCNPVNSLKSSANDNPSTSLGKNCQSFCSSKSLASITPTVPSKVADSTVSSGSKNRAVHKNVRDINSRKNPHHPKRLKVPKSIGEEKSESGIQICNKNLLENALDTELENILDIPIIIAKDDEGVLDIANERPIVLKEATSLGANKKSITVLNNSNSIPNSQTKEQHNNITAEENKTNANKIIFQNQEISIQNKHLLIANPNKVKVRKIIFAKKTSTSENNDSTIILTSDNNSDMSNLIILGTTDEFSYGNKLISTIQNCLEVRKEPVNK